MSFDLSQFHQTFFEEAAEHLASMESLLLEIDVDDPDPEQLNAIFRAAHSIKGSSGTFGFTDLQDLTHLLENLLDRVRRGEVPLRSEMVDASLATGDLLAQMLAAHRGGAAADPVAIAAAAAQLQALADSHGQQVPDMGLFADESAGDGTATPAAEAATAPAPAPAGATDLGTPAAAPATVAAETAFGLFTEDELPATDPASTGASALPVAAAPAPAAADADGAYGFFTDTPAAPTAPAAAPAPATVAADADGAYGFFTDVPAPAAAPAVPPASTLPAAAPAPADAAPAARPAREKKAAAPAAGGDTSIRVGIDKVDQLINLVGELVITQAMLAQSAQGVDPVAFERLHNGLAQLERNTRDLQESVMSIRMMPMSVVFSRFPRVVRDLSQKLGKQVELKTSGETTELDKGLIERITDPLTHLIRNSLDHGIEMPEDRAAKGKQPVGTITLSAYHQSGNIVIEVGDDGAGLNRNKILSKAKERGLPVHDNMTDGEVWMLIFEAGFSTADQITEVSGRGVGMDVVKRNITSMGGRVEISSMQGVGTRMTVRLPLTLAILDGMSVAAGHETYIIPLGYVIESLQAEKEMIKSVSGVERLIQVRGEYLPVVALHEIFKIPQAITRLNEGIMVVVEADGIKAALFIDALVGQHQVVIKSLEANYRKVPGIAGATIMGDGHVALILDVAALVQMARQTTPRLALAA